LSLMVGEVGVGRTSAFNDLSQGAGETAPLTPNGNFQERPHRANTKSNAAPRVAGRVSDSDYKERRVPERVFVENDDEEGAVLAGNVMPEVWKNNPAPKRFGQAMPADTDQGPQPERVVALRKRKKRAHFPRIEPLARPVEPPPPEELLSISDTCRWLEISRRELRKLTDAGDLVAKQQDGRTWITETSIYALQEMQRPPHNPQPRIADEAYVRACLSRAAGQPYTARGPIEWRDEEVRRTLRHLVEDCDTTLDLRALVDREYPRLLESLIYVLAHDVDSNEYAAQLPPIPARPFTEAEAKILQSHEPLLIKYAAIFSGGNKSSGRFLDLMDVGQQMLIRLIPKCPADRKIGGFAKPYIIGAMRDRLDTTIRTSSMSHDDWDRAIKENVERWRIYGDEDDDELDGVTIAKARKKAVTRKAKTQAAKPAPPAIPVARTAALAKMTDVQRQIYDNMHAKTKFSGRDMARRLRISETLYRRRKDEVLRILKGSMR
jgi:hypothetical protein